MERRLLSDKQILAFEKHLKSEEKSQNTVDKYIRDVRAFAVYANCFEITKETVINYKNKLISDGYAVRSINSMVASVNSLFVFLGWIDLRAKQ